MVAYNPFVVNVGFDTCNNTPDRGFLKYPFAILRSCGVKARFWASYWAMSSTPNPIYSPAPLAACGCMPVKTIKKQIADLVRDGDLAAYQDRQRITYAPTVQVGEAVSMAYSVGQPFVKVPRAWFHYWPDATFTELLLLGLYRFKLTDGLTGESWQHPCKLTMGEIQERIGFTVLTWKRAASALQDRGLIVRARHSKGYNVTLPV